MRETLLRMNQDAKCKDYRYYDPSFLRSLADVPLNQIAKDYGYCVAEAVREYFIANPSARYLDIIGKDKTAVITIQAQRGQQRSGVPCMGEAVREPRRGDIIQTGLIYANGDGSIVWGTHQVIRWISSDGTLWYRPRGAKVDKCSSHWRFPVESKDAIIKSLKHWANPKETRTAIDTLRSGVSHSGERE